MMKKLRNWTLAVLFVTTVGGMWGAMATPQVTHAACSDRLLTLPAWYKGLTDDQCNIVSPNEVGGLSQFIWKIVLNIIEIMMQLVGYIAVGFLIRGGFKYMTAMGEAGEVVKAKNIIRNALIGLLLAIVSVALVNFIAGAF